MREKQKWPLRDTFEDRQCHYTQKITKAVGMFAASKMRKTAGTHSSQPNAYAETIRSVIGHLAYVRI